MKRRLFKSKKIKPSDAQMPPVGPWDKTPTRFTRRVRKLIRFFSGVLLLIFGWIQLRNFPLDSLANSITPILLWQGALALYFASWVFGTTFDVEVQELVYVAFPEKGKVPAHGVMVILLLVVVGGILLWTERDIQRFAIALDIFILVDHLAWRYLIGLIKEVVSTSQHIYKENGRYFDLEKLNIVSYQIQGNWKWWRLTGTMPFVMLINAFAFSDTIHSYLTSITTSLLPFSSEDASAFVSGALVLCFVLVAEVWHWVIRIKTKVSLEFIDRVEDKYRLVPANNP